MRKVELLDDAVEIKKIDRSGMLEVVGRLPEMITEAESLASRITLPKLGQIKQVFVLGMGGSAISGDIAADLFFKSARAQILTSRNYNLPEAVGGGALVIVISYSGNTEETLAALKEAERRSCKIIIITSGGKLQEIAVAKKYPLVMVPAGYQPRAALPLLLMPLLTVLHKLEIIPPVAESVKETVAQLVKLKTEWGANVPARSNPVKQLAKKLVGRLPLVFGVSGTTAAAAYRWKTQLNENSKVTALTNCFPELNHNEIVNLSVLKRAGNLFSLVILRDEDDNERVKKRIEITKSLLVNQLGGASEITAQGKSGLAKIFSLIFFGDLLSVYLAILNGIDPTPVEVIERLKKELAR